MKKILITYATKTETTKEIAEEIGKVLEQCQLAVDIKAIKDVDKLEEYEGVVIGGPINGMTWHAEAVQFVENNQEQLNKIPTAYYNVSYLINDGRKIWRKAIKKSLNKVSTMVEPVMVGMFGGKIDSAFSAVPRFIFGVKKDAPLDIRNWDAISIWADELSRDFG